jgi:hypothetical protein
MLIFVYVHFRNDHEIILYIISSYKEWSSKDGITNSVQKYWYDLYFDVCDAMCGNFLIEISHYRDILKCVFTKGQVPRLTRSYIAKVTIEYKRVTIQLHRISRIGIIYVVNNLNCCHLSYAFYMFYEIHYSVPKYRLGDWGNGKNRGFINIFHRKMEVGQSIILFK